MFAVVIAALLGGSSPTPSPIPTQITSPLFFEIDCANGNDLASCTDAGPCKTPGAAVDKLRGKVIRSSVNVHIVGSSCTGVSLANPEFDPSPDGGLTGIRFFSELVNATVATGLPTGTLTSVTTGDATTGVWTVFNDTGQSWTVNDLRAKQIEILTGTGATTILPIISNTATSVTVPVTPATSATGATYAIRDYQATITTPVPIGGSFPAYNAAAQQPAAVLAGIAIQNVNTATRNSFIRFEGIRVNITSGTAPLAEVYFNSGLANVAFARMSFTSSIGGTSFSGSGYGIANITGCVWNRPNVSTVFSFSGGAGTVVPGFSLSNSYVRNLGNSTLAFNIGFNHNGISLSSIQVDTDTLLAFTGPATVIMSGAIVKTFTSNSNFGIRARDGFGSDLHAGVFLHLEAGGSLTVSNCASSTAIGGGGPGLVYLFEGNLLGTNNLVGISLFKGAKMEVSAGSTITGTTEVSMDGTSTTLATMRAASPKLITNTYGTLLFE